MLVVAFVVLYPVPTSTRDWFAWQIRPTMTAMVLASAYAGGAYFFLRAWRAGHWHTVKAGFVPVTLFASSLGIATILHWDKFNHDHLAFWLWSGLYFTTPFLVAGALLRNHRVARPPAAGELRLSQAARIVAGGAGLAAVALGLFVYVAPGAAGDVWPWPVTPLTARVVGSVLLLGVAGLAVYLDPRWSAVRLILQVERIMIALILVAAARARDQFATDRPLTWMLGGGLLALLVASTLLDRVMQRQSALQAGPGEVGP